MRDWASFVRRNFAFLELHVCCAPIGTSGTQGTRIALWSGIPGVGASAVGGAGSSRPTCAPIAAGAAGAADATDPTAYLSPARTRLSIETDVYQYRYVFARLDRHIQDYVTRRPARKSLRTLVTRTTFSAVASVLTSLTSSRNEVAYVAY
ncbi:hypothetical protein A9R05_15625 [Burkholderia sp. KK1]|nr:hypothetical protein A9R05_15625 [Burkholderia sp. KK1]